MEELRTARLRLVAPSLSFAKDVFEYASDPAFCEFIDSTPARSVIDAEAFISSIIKDNEVGRRIYWAVTLNGRAIGTVGYVARYALRHKTIELGYGIGAKYWGQGYFSEAARAVIRHGFDVLGFKRIEIPTRADNMRSINGAIRLGFTREATLKSFYETGHGRVDCALFALVRDA
jgi:[ribosomal protein S5]-alanine N-acetyltransferase